VGVAIVAPDGEARGHDERWVMGESTVFAIGAKAMCTDGPCGVVIKVVVDPVARAVTHLVVEPRHRSGLGRLVPVDLVEPGPDQVRIACTMAQFDRFAYAEETQFYPGGLGPYEAYDAEHVVAWPYVALGGTLVEDVGLGNTSVPVVSDTLPVGEVAVRRGDRVQATDGEIGRVQGLVIDRATRHVTHVLLQEGHLWDRKEVAIPISAVTQVDEEGIAVNMNKDEVGHLPPVDVDHPAAT
jgi:sporulation protein YlmC with PRC-barrel domain